MAHSVFGFFLLLGDSYRKCVINVSQTVSLLEHLGFIINNYKSVLIPNNTVVYLGFEFNSIDLAISVPNDKCNKSIQLLQDFKKLNQFGNGSKVRILTFFYLTLDLRIIL